MKPFWIIRLSSLGDIIVTTSALSWIKHHYPEAHIYFITASEYKGLFVNDPRIKEVISFDRKNQTLWDMIRFIRQSLVPKMKSEGGVIIDLHNTLRAKVIKALVPLQTIVTLKKLNFRRLFLCLFKINLLKQEAPLAHRICNQLSATLLPKENFLPLNTTLYPPSKSSLNFEHIKPDQIYIGIVPVANWPGKRWPSNHFVRLIQKIQTETSYHCIVFGGPQDTYASLIAKEGKAISLVGQLSLSNTLGIMNQFCKMVIANDTGLMHMADALNIPTCVLLGPTHASMGYPPLGKDSFICSKELWCQPCSRTGEAPCIRLGNRACLSTLFPEHVFDVCQKRWGWQCLT
jgi:heptosyltransferase II